MENNENIHKDSSLLVKNKMCRIVCLYGRDVEEFGVTSGKVQCEGTVVSDCVPQSPVWSSRCKESEMNLSMSTNHPNSGLERQFGS